MVEFINNEPLIEEYIRSYALDPTKVIRVTDDEVQIMTHEIVIPAAVLNQNNGGLGIRVWCYRTVKELRNVVRDAWVNFEYWQNVYGEPEKPVVRYTDEQGYVRFRFPDEDC